MAKYSPCERYYLKDEHIENLWRHITIFAPTVYVSIRASYIISC